MASSPAEATSSCEEDVFFGPFTLKEVRARLLPKHVRRAMKHANKKKDINDSDNSVKIIEIHSEPEIDIKNDLMDIPKVVNKFEDSTFKLTDNSYCKLSPNDSFLRIEKQVADCCISENKNHGLNNSFKVDNFFLNVSNENNSTGTSCQLQQHCNPNIQVNIKTPTKEQTNEVNYNTESIKMEEIGTVQLQSHDSCDIVSTPKNKTNNTDIFKTPMSTRKQQASSIKKSPRNVNVYQHVISPIALYIKGPQAPLLRNTSQKPPTVSFIPKLEKNTVENKIGNKENIQLQPFAYRSSKGTAVIHKKFPQSDWLDKATSSTHYVVKKHVEGEVTPKKPLVPQDDSLVNLSLISQADESLHTEMSEFTVIT